MPNHYRGDYHAEQDSGWVNDSSGWRIVPLPTWTVYRTIYPEGGPAYQSPVDFCENEAAALKALDRRAPESPRVVFQS
jgi:hypothetical protein